MPELPEVETVVRGLSATLVNRKIKSAVVNRAAIRTPITPGFADRVAGQKILGVRRRAKYLLIDLSHGDTILAHLGMSGKLVITRTKPEKKKHDHAQFILSDALWLTFNDARRFGILEIYRTDEIDTLPTIRALGPEPFSKGFSQAYLKAALEKRTRPVKVALMDQGLVVGVGNIYASEALFDAKLPPILPAQNAAPYAKEIIAAIRKVLKKAIASGGSTLRDYVRSSGDAGEFQHRFQVYEREGKPCYACGSAIKKIQQAGRSTYYCPICQAVRKSKKS